VIKFTDAFIFDKQIQALAMLLLNLRKNNAIAFFTLWVLGQMKVDCVLT